MCNINLVSGKSTERELQSGKAHKREGSTEFTDGVWSSIALKSRRCSAGVGSGRAVVVGAGGASAWGEGSLLFEDSGQ